MKYFAIAGDVDTLTGLRLAGIDGELADGAENVRRLIDAAVADESVAVLVITQTCADLCHETLTQLRLSASRPLVAVIPDSKGGKVRDEMATLIGETIGVRI